LLISGSSNVTICDLPIDYNPLPFTQGTIGASDSASLQIIVKIDPGYPDDPAFLATITDGFFKVVNRHTRALKAGARDFLSRKRVERVMEGLIKISTNSDGSHFITVERDPTMEDCTCANTSDDALNAHGSYGCGTVTTWSRRYLFSPEWDVDLVAGDEIETCEHGTFRSLGRASIEVLTKRDASELKRKIPRGNKSPTTQPDLVYDVVL
jgi:hypothetical protein